MASIVFETNSAFELIDSRNWQKKYSNIIQSRCNRYIAFGNISNTKFCMKTKFIQLEEVLLLGIVLIREVAEWLSLTHYKMTKSTV